MVPATLSGNVKVPLQLSKTCVGVFDMPLCLLQAIETLKSFEKKDSKVASTAATNLSFLYFLVSFSFSSVLGTGEWGLGGGGWWVGTYRHICELQLTV